LGLEQAVRGELDEDEQGGGLRSVVVLAAGADFGGEARFGEGGYELCEGRFCFGGFWREGW
jgi:hypothetical protein